jgi:hypothetical protein
MATQRSKDSNWINAQRMYFSGDSELWALRNKIKSHACARLISIPLMFTHLRDNIAGQEPKGNKKYWSVAAACELLELLDHIQNSPIYYQD